MPINNQTSATYFCNQKCCKYSWNWWWILIRNRNKKINQTARFDLTWTQIRSGLGSWQRRMMSVPNCHSIFKAYTNTAGKPNRKREDCPFDSPRNSFYHSVEGNGFRPEIWIFWLLEIFRVNPDSKWNTIILIWEQMTNLYNQSIEHWISVSQIQLHDYTCVDFDQDHLAPQYGHILTCEIFGRRNLLTNIIIPTTIIAQDKC